MILALQHHKIVKSSYNIFIGYYHNVPFSHFGAEDFSTAKLKKKKKKQKKKMYIWHLMSLLQLCFCKA